MKKLYANPQIFITAVNPTDLITTSGGLEYEESGFGDRIDFNDFIK